MARQKKRKSIASKLSVPESFSARSVSQLGFAQLGIFSLGAIAALVGCSLLFASTSQADPTLAGDAGSECLTCLGASRNVAQGATQPLAGNSAIRSGLGSANGWGPNAAVLVGRVDGQGPLQSLLQFPGELPSLPAGPQPVYQGTGMIPGSFNGAMIPVIPGFEIGKWQVLAPPSFGALPPAAFVVNPGSAANGMPRLGM